MHRALIIGRAYQQWQATRSAHGTHAACTKVLHKEYVKVRRTGDNPHLRSLAIKLQYDTLTNAPGGYEDLIKLSQHMQYNIILLNISNEYRPSCIEFDSRRSHKFDDDKQLYLVRGCESRGGGRSHFHAVTNIRAFFGVSYYCQRCNVGSNDKFNHRCPDDLSCDMCRRMEAEHKEPLAEPIICEVCFRSFTDLQCEFLHRQILCKKSWFCVSCKRDYPHHREKAAHKCYERKCYKCDEWYTGEHLCYIQPKAAKSPLAPDRIKTFDFESDMSQGGHHIPNFASVCYGPNPDQVTEYHNNGDSIMDMFMDNESSMPRIEASRTLLTTPKDTTRNSSS